jgi:hypothetical protein
MCGYGARPAHIVGDNGTAVNAGGISKHMRCRRSVFECHRTALVSTELVHTRRQQPLPSTLDTAGYVMAATTTMMVITSCLLRQLLTLHPQVFAAACFVEVA